MREVTMSSSLRDRIANEMYRVHVAAKKAPTFGELAEAVIAVIGVSYRPGLPSIEQVCKHEAHGGLWMILGPEGWKCPQIAALCFGPPHDSPTPTVCIRNGYAFWQSLSGCIWAAAARYRPCTREADPVPWSEVES